MKSKILKKNKKAIFLSMELIIVLTVITSLLSVTTFMGLRVYQNSKITKIINQIDEIRASISSFESTFGFYPGDVNLEVINSGINLSIVKNNYAKVITAEEPTDGNTDSLFTSAKSDSISMQKSQLAFQQMSVAGMFDFPKSQNYQISETSGCDNLSQTAGNLFPYIKDHKDAVWMIVMDVVDYSTYPQNFSYLSPSGGIVYNALFYSNFSGSPRLLGVGTNFTGCSPNVSAGIGAISSDLTYGIDQKIDTGNPKDANSVLLADGISGAGGCSYIPTNIANATIFDEVYSMSTSDVPADRCVITFAL